MFCEKCGTKNADDAKFCENCGNPMMAEEPVVVEQPKQEFVAPAYEEETTFVAQPAEKKPMSLKNKIVLIIVAAILVLCTAFYFVGKTVTDPKNVVKKFMDGIVSQNFEQIYDCFEIPEGKFTTKEMFAKVIKETMDENDIEIADYDIHEDRSSSKLQKVYEVEIKEKGSSYIDTEEFVLTKQKGKSWLFFDTYKMELDELVEKDFDIYAPAGITITVEGIVLDDSYVESVEYGTVHYVIDYIFGGYYNYTAEAPFIETENDKFMASYGDAYIDSFRINQDMLPTMKSKTEVFINNLCAAAIEGKSFDEVKEYFAENDSEYIREEYEQFCKRVKNDDGANVKTFAVSDLEYDSYDTYYDGSYDFSATYKYTYSYTYKSFDGTIEEVTVDNPVSGYIDVDFVYENDAWEISDFSLSMFYY